MSRIKTIETKNVANTVKKGGCGVFNPIANIISGNWIEYVAQRLRAAYDIHDPIHGI